MFVGGCFAVVCNGEDYTALLKQAASTFIVMVNAFQLFYYPHTNHSPERPHNCIVVNKTLYHS
jgi:hypothetical protein